MSSQPFESTTPAESVVASDPVVRAQELLNSLGTAPVEEHPDLFDQIHNALTQSLNEIDGL